MRVTDREFLCWMHDRLTEVHGERPLMDYMHMLRALIRATPPGRRTPATFTCNSLPELLRQEAKETNNDE